MTAFQGLKTVAVLGVLAGLAACGQAEKTADKADATAEATQAAPEAASATGGAPTIDQMMGVQAVSYTHLTLPTICSV